MPIENRKISHGEPQDKKTLADSRDLKGQNASVQLEIVNIIPSLLKPSLLLALLARQTPIIKLQLKQSMLYVMMKSNCNHVILKKRKDMPFAVLLPAHPCIHLKIPNSSPYMDLLIVVDGHNHTVKENRVFNKNKNINGRWYFFMTKNSSMESTFHLNYWCIRFKLCHKSTDKCRVWDLDLSIIIICMSTES